MLIFRIAHQIWMFSNSIDQNTQTSSDSFILILYRLIFLTIYGKTQNILKSSKVTIVQKFSSFDLYWFDIACHNSWIRGWISSHTEFFHWWSPGFASFQIIATFKNPIILSVKKLLWQLNMRKWVTCRRDVCVCLCINVLKDEIPLTSPTSTVYK